MTTALMIVILVVIIALIFDYINGFHDTANAIATVVSTGVLPMRTAILLAASLNFIGAFFGTHVASTIGKGLIVTSEVTQILVLSALCGAIFWNLFTWYFGIPSSSSHALIGGLVGAGLAKSGTNAIESAGIIKTVKALVGSPILGFFVSFFFMIAIFWIFRRQKPVYLNKLFRRLQMLSAAIMAFSHGNNDAQKTMGVITMSLAAYGIVTVTPGTDLHVPLWVVVSCATAMALGTAAGGVRIIKTMGSKIIDIKPMHGFAAETGAAMTILTASVLGVPVSTTHVISGCIMGVGASQKVSAVRWGVTIRILWAWVLTIPLSAGASWLFYQGLERVLG